MIRSRKNLYICKIDATAFSTIMIVLLLGAYVLGSAATPGFHANNSWLWLPKATHANAQWDATRPDAMIITVMWNGKLFVGFEQVTVEQIVLKINERQSIFGAPSKIYLKVDANAPYRLVKQVINAVRSAGVERVTFLTRPTRFK